ncbi:HNH endonuclease [Candidatus Kaiserbacteria bacterium]|nr:HNH endonuclease [Candidatus Kaiserbacteria bacterium]
MKARIVKERGAQCERCNYDLLEILIVHHIDRNRDHNSLSNLELLCPNCHAKEHYLKK